MPKKKRRAIAKIDPSSPYAMARAGRVSDAIKGYENALDNNLSRLRLAELYLVAGQARELGDLITLLGPDERKAVLDALVSQSLDAPGYFRTGRFRRDRARERTMVSDLRTRFPSSRTARAMVEPREVNGAGAADEPPRRIEDREVPGFVRSKRLDWELLPPEEVGRLIGRGGTPLRSGATPHLERLRFLDGLRPSAWYVGSELGSRIYYVAVFPHAAVADSAEYGNALYLYRRRDGDWQRVFRSVKREAVALGARRIVHRGDWQARLLSALR